jgi:transglutaminase-like putative cysteine protease
VTRAAALALSLTATAHAADGGAPSIKMMAPAEPRPETLFVGAFPLESRLSRSLFGGGAAEITLQFDAAGAGGSNELVRRLRIAIAADGRLVVGSTPYPPATDRPTRQHTRPSFLIDYDQPVFKRVLADARAELGASPSIADITQFVDRFITHKGMARGYDIASIVATRREGDCTEHAVLLAAVARGLKVPARVASGIAVVEIDGKPRSFGHAWAEIYRGGRWQIADAAFRQTDKLVYLPLELLSDEGPGYALSMMKTNVGTLGVRRIIVAEPEARPRSAPGR